jgi:hypothetical protein
LDDICVSGNVFSRSGKDEIYIPLLGVRDDYLSQGAGYAPLYFLVRWAKQQGYSKIDYGACNPFLTDGVFHYKRTWGMAIRPLKENDPKIHAIKFLNFGEGTKAFISDNPFIFAENGKLEVLATLTPGVSDVLDEFGVIGIHGLVILSPIFDTGASQPSQMNTLNLRKEADNVSSPLKSLIALVSESLYATYFYDY